MVTPRLTPDDPPLAFISNRIYHIASKIDKLWVITPRAQKYNFPENVMIIEVGRHYQHRENILHAFIRFHNNMWWLTRNERIDGIFTFMYPEFAILAYPYARISRVKLIMWYAHDRTNWKLTLASKLVERVLTTSYETCRIRSDKVYPIGQGIDIDTFRGYPKPRPQEKEQTINFVSVGRISPIKHLETIIDAANTLLNQYRYINLHFSFVGTPPVQEHHDYKKLLEARIKNYGLEKNISFIGNIPHNQLPAFYQNVDFFVSSSLSGADKAIFEAMACEIPVIVSHPVFKEILKPYADDLMYKSNDVQDLVRKLIKLISLPYEDWRLLGQSLRAVVKANHSLELHINKIISAFNE